MDKAEQKEKKILTSNRMVTINKRETSFEGLLSKFEEGGEDNIYNLFTGGDKNIPLTQKYEISEKDLAEIPGLVELKAAIESAEKNSKNLNGRTKFLAKKQIIEMRQQQYLLKSAYRKPTALVNGNSADPINSFAHIPLDENITINGEEVTSDAILNFYNPTLVLLILRNYEDLKRSVEGKFQSDAWYFLQDFDALVERTFADQPILRRILDLKRGGYTNQEIQEWLQAEFDVNYCGEHLSSLWCQKIPKLIVAKATEEYLDWYYTFVEKGAWKRCSKCKCIKLASPKYFSRNKTGRDGFYSICKKCRNERYKANKQKTKE